MDKPLSTVLHHRLSTFWTTRAGSLVHLESWTVLLALFFFIVRYANLLGSCRPRRPACLSYLLSCCSEGIVCHCKPQNEVNYTNSYSKEIIVSGEILK